MKKTFIILFVLLVTAQIHAQSGWELRIMPQAAFGTRNTIQRPNNAEGTRVDLHTELSRKNSASFSPRFELEYNYKRHHFIATAALLNDKFEGIPQRDIYYNGNVFGAGNQIEAGYRFNTYRLGYRYRLVNNPRFTFELGATLLLRDAYISMENSVRKETFSNVGVAPLLSYMVEWKATGQLSLLTYGDAFAIKVGRAEDLFIGAKYRFSPLISATAGYRLLEGGSDGDRVYTMSMFHFISLGIGFTF